MDTHGDRTKFHKLVIEFVDLKAKEDFKRLTNTDSTDNRTLDFELIFPLPPKPSLHLRIRWRDNVWGSDAMDCNGETMKEEGNRIIYEFTTRVGIPIEFVKHLYLYSRIKKVTINCFDGGDIAYANEDGTAPCEKTGCNHLWCDVVMQEWEAKYDWSKRPHPLLEVNIMLDWIKDYFSTVNDTEAAKIYHQILHDLIKFREFSESDLAQGAKLDFEEQVSVCGNAYLQTVVMLNEYEKSPEYQFKHGQRVLYRDLIDYYFNRTKRARLIPRFSRRAKKK